MRDSLESVFRDTPPLAFLAGHDHGLQVLSGRGVRYVLVSGSGSYDHNNAVRRLDSTRYASDKPGFMRVDALKDGRVRLSTPHHKYTNVYGLAHATVLWYPLRSFGGGYECHESAHSESCCPKKR